MSKNRWGYERVILNVKAKEVILKAVQKLKLQADLAGVKIEDVSMATVLDEKSNMWFELTFWSDEKKHTMTSNDLDDFDTKFIDFLFSKK